MAEIVLSSGAICLVDDEDFPTMAKYNWGEHRCPKTSYAQMQTEGIKYLMHRLLVNCPKNRWVDPINSNGLDNRRNNLRIILPSQNTANVSKQENCTSKYLGVRLDRGKYWRASATSKHGVRYHLGNFDSEEKAALAYNKFVLKYNPLSKLNVIEE